MRRFVFLLCTSMTAAALLGAQSGGVDHAKLLNPGTDSWPTYNGDYSGRRFSTLTKVNATNVGTLSLAWASRVSMPTGASSSVVGSGVFGAFRKTR